MERTLDTNAYLDAVCQMLAEGAESVPVPVAGNSMQPFLRPGDYVHVGRAEHIRRGDILLFQRPGGQYVLHRVVKIGRDSLLMLGDNQREREPIDRSWVRAKAISANIRGKTVTAHSFRWWLFAYLWHWLSPWRRQIVWLHGIIFRK